MKEYAPIIEMCLLAVLEKGEVAIKTICNCNIPSHVMLVEYKKLSMKIEDISLYEKEKMWGEVYEMFHQKSKEERIKVCKIIHCISELL